MTTWSGGPAAGSAHVGGAWLLAGADSTRWASFTYAGGARDGGTCFTTS
jgi:hypothetical protein